MGLILYILDKIKNRIGPQGSVAFRGSDRTLRLIRFFIQPVLFKIVGTNNLKRSMRYLYKKIVRKLYKDRD